MGDCEDLAKAALRDLGCDVELKELWTGTGQGKVHHWFERAQRFLTNQIQP